MHLSLSTGLAGKSTFPGGLARSWLGHSYGGGALKTPPQLCLYYGLLRCSQRQEHHAISQSDDESVEDQMCLPSWPRTGRLIYTG